MVSILKGFTRMFGRFAAPSSQVSPITEASDGKPKDPRATRKQLMEQMTQATSYLFTAYVNKKYNPDKLVRKKGGINIYYEMQTNDEQVKAVLAIKRHSVLAGGWEVTSEPGQEEIGDYVKENLTKVQKGFTRCLKNMLSAYGYGFSITEKLLSVFLPTIKV